MLRQDSRWREARGSGVQGTRKEAAGGRPVREAAVRQCRALWSGGRIWRGSDWIIQGARFWLRFAASWWLFAAMTSIHGDHSEFCVCVLAKTFRMEADILGMPRLFDTNY